MLAMCELAGMEKLSRYLTDTGTRQSQFADALGISRSYLNELLNSEATRKQPSPALAVRIENATKGGVPVEAWPAYSVLADRSRRHRNPPSGDE